VDQVDHEDHDPPWWTRSVQDHREPPYDIFLMPPSRAFLRDLALPPSALPLPVCPGNVFMRIIS